jgi:hypothetical protein
MSVLRVEREGYSTLQQELETSSLTNRFQENRKGLELGERGWDRDNDRGNMRDGNDLVGASNSGI